MIDALKAPNAYAILNGDLCESSIRTSKGDIFRQVGTPQDQRDWIIKRLMPVRKKLLGCVRGNHEKRIDKEVGIDLCKDISRELGCPYRPAGLLLKISFGCGNEGHEDRPYVYFVYATHGYGGARTSGAKIMKLKRTASYMHADVYIQSHDHTQIMEPEPYLMPDPRTYTEKDNEGNETGFIYGQVKEYPKRLVKTGATVMWGEYAEEQGMPPSTLGTPEIWLAGTQKPRVRVTI